MQWNDVRRQFPALEAKTFLDAACVSLTPRVAAEAIQSFLDSALYCPERSSTEHHIVMDGLRAELRPLVARMLEASEDEIAIVESTTHGLSLAANILPLERGERVLVCDLEFLQLAVPWCQLRDARGIEIDVVPNRNGTVLAEDIAEAITPRTRVLAVSSVQWSNGFRIDLDAVSALCREKGLWPVVDAIQQLGAVPIDVRQTPVDLLTTGGHKWLNAPFGTGFLYLRRESHERAESSARGLFESRDTGRRLG